MPDLFDHHHPDLAATFRPSLPGADLEYRPGFIKPEVAKCWFDELMQEGAIEWRQDRIRMYGREVLIPRLNAWYGDARLDYSYSGIPMRARPWSGLLAEIRDRVEEGAGTRFTSVLINLYRDGNDSVAWHADDEPELGRQPVIASLSLGAEREFQMRHRRWRENGLATFKIALQSGSLLIMRGDTQRNWLHQVPKRSTRTVSEPRVNLTFRRICHFPA